MVQFHDPRAKIGITNDPHNLRLDLARQNSARVACLANGYPDSERFLEQIAAVLEQQLPNIECRQFNKGNASIAAPQDLLQEIADCQVAIAAYGH